jgi:undecaprenyl-diphosphatase
MDFFQTAVLSLVQGITEFLPISSSAHLILVPVITGWQDQGLAFDVAVHAGTLAAVVVYFRDRLIEMAAGLVRARFSPADREAKLAWTIVFATLPVALAGVLFKDFIETSLRLPSVIAASTIIFALVLWWSDQFSSKQRDEYAVTWKDALIIGLAQALALVPGTSRAGITMTAALFLGLNRAAAARFSFLLSIPTLFAAGVFVTGDLVASTEPVDWSVLMLGFVLSAISAYLSMHFFIRLVDRIGMTPFVIYRLALGTVLFLVFT